MWSKLVETPVAMALLFLGIQLAIVFFYELAKSTRKRGRRRRRRRINVLYSNLTPIKKHNEKAS